MSTGNEKRQRKRATRVRRANQPAARSASTTSLPDTTETMAREHYRREKARRADRPRPPEHPLEQARRAYQALLAADAERAKGGRPKKEPAPTKRKPASSADAETESED